jgi:hypothetical protein
MRALAGPKAVLAYLSRYRHRVAISNRRLIAFDGRRVTFKVKDYRIEGSGRYTTMTFDVDEFIRRFLIHVLPKGFHRIRRYGLFAGQQSRRNDRLTWAVIERSFSCGPQRPRPVRQPGDAFRPSLCAAAWPDLAES